MEQNFDELAAIEALNSGKTFAGTKNMDVRLSISTIRYYAGWADKIHGQVIETQENILSYTRREPFGVVGQIIPTNFPRTRMLSDMRRLAHSLLLHVS
jgi:aldehyde dehydrogenase (NAD+)